MNPFGDQVPEAVDAAFSGEDVVAATSYTTWTFVVEGRAIPGLAAEALRGSLGPTVLDGAPVRADDEIVLGRRTMERLGVGVGDTVDVQVAGRGEEDIRAPVALRVVGAVTFPPVVLSGVDTPRLGTGALVTAATYYRMAGLERGEDGPEWTSVLLADDARANALIAANPDGIADARGIPTTWYTDAKPAELRQLDAVRSLLVGAVGVAYLIVLAIIAHALWSAAREHRHDLAVLAAIGFTRRQRGMVTSWQAVPLVLAVLAIGMPLGVAVGRWIFSSFAGSLGVVDDAASPPSMIGGLVIGVFAATLIGVALAVAVARRAPSAVTLRER
jgi:hypothetical protein